MTVLRADGHLKFSEHNVRLDFGLRQGNRSADNENFALIAPVYPGLAYYNPVIDPVTGEEDLSTRIPVPEGCYQHYKAGDIVLDGQGIPGACKAGDPVTGFFRANPLVGLNPSQLGAMIADNTRLYNHLADVQGISVYDLDPKIMDDVLAFQNALYPGEIRDHDPAGTWHVDVHQTTGYLQANFTGTAPVHYGANVGVKLIRTHLGIDQHSVSPDPVAYYVNPHDGGIVHTDRSFTDVLPVANLFVDLRDDLKLRVAYAKNMQLLDLDQWGGGLTLNYAFTAGPPAVFAVYGGQQANLILWYQDKSLEVRIAGNYRSKRAVEKDYGGITGFQEYQEPTTYLDASASYSFAKHFQVFIDGSNLTGEIEKYYLVWPDMKLNTTQFESRYALGVRAKF
jgi:hypothetical protein